MSERWRRFKDDLSYRGRALTAWWRALTKAQQWQIAGGLCVLAALAMTAAIWYVWGRRGPAHNEDINTDVVLYTSVTATLARPTPLPPRSCSAGAGAGPPTTKTSTPALSFSPGLTATWSSPSSSSSKAR